MRSTVQEKVLRLLLQALKPLVHLLIESGIGHKEFSEIAKRAYVDVASKTYGLRGRDTNISRVAVMTGLTRKEVKRVKDALSGEVDEHSPKPIPASVVLAQWYTDERYCDENGAPRELTFDEGEPSFTSLVREYAGDIPPGAIRTELVRVGSVEVTEKGNIIPLRRYYLPAEGSDRLLRALERPLPLLLQNIRQNNLRPPLPRDHLTWPEMVVQIDKINPTMRIELRDFAYKKITEFAEDMDDCLSEFRAANQSNTQEELSVGVGFYYFEVR